MPYPNEHAARLKEPGQFTRYARKNDQGGAGIDFIIGFRKDGSSDVQAIRFDKTRYSPEQAKTWLSKHGFSPIDFENAAINAAEYASRLEDWFEVAKTGSFPQGDLNEAMFDEVVASFDPSFHEPPITLGHIRPDTHNDKPAAGWIAGLKRIGNTLYAKAKQVAADFDSAIQEGRFKKRSIGLRASEDGKLYLHHLAFLGAMPPAVKGLQNIYSLNYSADKSETEQSFEFTQNQERVKIMELTEKELDAKLADAAAKGKADAEKSFAEQVKTETEKTAKETREAVAKEFADKAAADKAAAEYSGEVESFLKEFSEADKLSPAQVALLRPFLLTMNPKTEIEFTEKDDKGTEQKVNRNALKVVRDLFANSTVISGDFADTKGGAKGGDYAEEKAKAEELMKSDKSLNFRGALMKARAIMNKKQ